MDAFRLPLLFGIALAGATGTLARYGLSTVVGRRLADTGFPWGTVTVNILGCYLFGLVWSLAENRAWIGAEARIILLVGFMGGFTTFSSFGYETYALFRDAEWSRGLANILLQNSCGILFLWLGVLSVRLAERFAKLAA